MLTIFNSEEDVAIEIAKEMKRQLELDQPVFCLASGSTPEKSYKKFAEEVSGDSRIRNLRVVSLDEWVGIDRRSEGSCFQMLNRDLFSRIQLSEKQILFFDGMAADLRQECMKIDRFTNENPITFSLMGVGMNGHIGLNEPGTPVFNHSSIVDLSETTRKVAQKYFNETVHLEKGITLGLGQIIESQKVIAVITGEKKARIVKGIFHHSNRKLPAQELLAYDHVDFYLDRDAAKFIE